MVAGQVSDSECEGNPVELSFVMPLGYPFANEDCTDAEPPSVSVLWGAARYIRALKKSTPALISCEPNSHIQFAANGEKCARTNGMTLS